MKQMTPLMRQYLKLKAKYKDSILLFQMGDFFECFYEDAKLLAKELNITLTKREKSDDAPPLAGFPIKALNTYLPQLIDKGYKVAIAEQVEDPKQAKGIVARKVTEIVTKGTYTNPENINSKTENNIASIYTDKYHITIAHTDILNGTISFTTLPINSEAIINETLNSITPNEIILDENQVLPSYIKVSIPIQYSKLKDTPEKLITKTLDVPNLDALDIESSTETHALALLINYISETKQVKPKHLVNIKRWDPRAYMFLDSMTIFNLELLRNQRSQTVEHSLLHALDNTKTSMGARLLRYFILHPLLDPEEINHRLKYTQQYTQHTDILNFNRENLEEIYDIERLVGLLGFGRISPKQLVMLKNSLNVAINITEKNTKLLKFQHKIGTVVKITNLIDESILNEPSNIINQGNIFKDSYNQEIKELRKLTNDSQSILNDILEKEKSKTGINTLKLGYNKVFGYYFEVPKGQISKVPKYFIRKQTLVNNERYITSEIKELETKILDAQERLIILEQQLYIEFIKTLQQDIEILQHVAKYIAFLDVINNFAYLALKRNYTKPEFKSSSNKEMILESARHPVVELYTEDFIPNSLEVNKDKNFIILTGPNMGGKSTFIRQVALIQLMAQIGCFVPANKAVLQIKDRIFARVGASDDIASGRSTFMVEMSEVSKILQNATQDSLIILDEVGRGTNTAEGFSLAYAISKYIAENIKAFTIFATHYHELTALTTDSSRFINYKVDVLEQDENVFFLHTISPGSTDKSYAIYVAKLVHLPEKIIKLANEKLTELNQEKMELNLKETHASTVRQQKPKQSTVASTDTPPQLTLFSSQDKKFNELKQKVKKIDINKITPLQALNLLYDLINTIKS